MKRSIEATGSTEHHEESTRNAKRISPRRHQPNNHETQSSVSPTYPGRPLNNNCDDYDESEGFHHQIALHNETQETDLDTSQVVSSILQRMAQSQPLGSKLNGLGDQYG
jgi:hypothetical protein